MVDELMHYELGPLGYRSLAFETETHKGLADYQGIAVVNEVSREVPFTRTIEHRHLTPESEQIAKTFTIITREYPQPWHIGREAYYPVNNASNKKLYEEYKKLIAARYPSIVLGGRLGNYRYYDMDDAISDALIAFRHNYYPSKM